MALNFEIRNVEFVYMNAPQRRLWLALLGLALIFRLGFAFQWQQRAASEDRLFRLGDSHSYWTLAEQLAAGKPYQYGSENAKVFRAPLYPIMLAPLAAVFETAQAVWIARVVGCLLGTLAVGLIMLVAKQLAGPCAALGCGFLAAIHPAAIGMSVIVLSEALFMPLMVLNLLLWQAAWAAKTRQRLLVLSVTTGVVCGLAVLTRPSWLLFLPFAACCGVVVSGNVRRHVGIVTVTFLAFCVTMLPWWIRNAQVTGHFVPTTLQVGPSLYDGLHAGATGASDEGMAFMQNFLAEEIAFENSLVNDLEATEAPQLDTLPPLEYRLNQRATRAALDWALANPGEVARLSARKFARTWSLWPDGGDVSSSSTRIALSVSCLGISLLALLAAVRCIRPFSWPAAICVLPTLYFTLLHMVFVGSVRYREPAIFVLTALAGCALAWLAGCTMRRDDEPVTYRLQSVQGSASVPQKEEDRIAD